MERHDVAITVLGTRGSVPVSGSSFSRYGGATTCVLFRAGEQYIALDAGTGLLSLPDEAMRRSPLALLLTHSHADHLLGLPLSPCVMTPGFQLDVYAASRGGLDARAQVERLLSPPLWPVGPDALPADIRFHDLPQTLRIGDITVETMEGEHPGGVTLLRLSANGTRTVFATDCTLIGALLPELAAFIRDCDLFLCDGQYRDDEWADRSTFGHSSWGYVARFAGENGVKRLRIVHHDPRRTDADLDRAAEALRAPGADYDFAKEGEVIEL